MSETLLQTKLYIPALRPNVVARQRLIECLNQVLRSGCKLLLVSAPAGYDKTTLLSRWARGCEWPVAWVSLDEVTQLNLSPEGVAALEARTEGWIAGLQMAALSMQGSRGGVRWKPRCFC